MNSRVSPKLPVLVFLLSTVLPAGAQPGRIVVIRHAEKPADEGDPNLSEEGRQRAERLVSWLSLEKVVGTGGPPAALYAAAPGARGQGVRCVQTLEPAARHFSLRIRTPHRPDEYEKLARQLLRSNSLRGKTVVVCWPHGELPELAAALGVKPEPPKWRDKDFDSAYVIDFPDGKASLERIRQKPKTKKRGVGR